MKYKVGDKVRIIDKWVDGCSQNREGEMDKWLGKVMTIRSIYENRAYRMEEDRTEHFGNGWLWNEKCIAGLADNHKIVITSDGKETLARLYEGNKVIKSATAKCSPDDEFDFAIGAKIAFERLMAEKKPLELKVGDRVRIIKGIGCGKSGKITQDDGTGVAPYLVKFDDGGELWKFGDRLELIEDKPKFEIGKYYKYVRGKFDDGIIKILKVDGDRAYYEIIDGLADDSSRKDFDIESPYAHCLALIEGYQEKPKYYNGKVVCVECEDKDYTVGKVYEFKDGTLVDDQGAVRYKHCRVKHPSEIVSIYKFIPYVE